MSQLINVNECHNAFTVALSKGKYVLLYKEKPFTIALEPANKDVSSGFFIWAQAKL